MFKRLSLKHRPKALSKRTLDGDEELLIFERGGARYGFKLLELAYHHVAQGDVDGEPTLIAFCGICHSGMGFSPIVDGKERHFSAGGLYDGIVLLIDDETRSYWNHMTGRAVYGPSVGAQLEPFGVDITTASAELQKGNDPLLYSGNPTFLGRIIAFKLRRARGAKGFMPFFFGKTMTTVDARADKMERGLGVVVGKATKFYPVSELTQPIEESLGDLRLRIRVRPEDHVPEALDDGGRRPMQLFCRWYGFSATYPDCEIFRASRGRESAPKQPEQAVD